MSHVDSDEGRWWAVGKAGAASATTWEATGAWVDMVEMDM